MPTAVLLPWDDEVNNTGSSNKKRRTSTANAAEAKVTADADGAIRPAEQRINITMDSVADSKMNLLSKGVCCNMRSARRNVFLGKVPNKILPQDRIAALDAIEFDWKLCYRSTAINSMIQRGDAVPIVVAPGGFG